jgi:6-phosphogluconolactonase
MTTIVYVSNADSGDISVLHLNADSGALTLRQSFATGGKVMPLAISPDRRFLYASLRDEPARVLSCSIDPGSGRLQRRHDAPLPASACFIAVDRSGRWLMSASYGGHRIGVNPIDGEGRAQPPLQSLSTEPNAHCFRTDRSNRFAYAACLGGDSVMQMRFDPTNGHVTPNAIARFVGRPGAGPRHLEFHPDGHIAYLLNELDASIDTLALDEATGQLSALHSVTLLPPEFHGEPWGADLHIAPAGRNLYACERRSSTLSVFDVDRQSGELHLIERLPTETQPRGFNIDPSGRHLVVAGQVSNRVTAYDIDGMSGKLRAAHSLAVGNNPNWVEIVDLA